LALDTSTQTASVALFRAGRVLEEHTWWSEQNHTTELAPAVASLLARQGVGVSELQAVAVAVGPGSFNGLRVGMSFAKGMACSLGLPVIGVSTLEALAYQQLRFRGLIRPLIPAGRGELNTALFSASRGRWRRLEPDRLAALESVVAETAHRTLFCAGLLPEQAVLLREQLGKRAVIASPAACCPRAGYLAELAWQRLQAGQGIDAGVLEPIYLRRPSIGGRGPAF
jgi:tRNA threonylcarbamoyladenosine biosynthesis protein TsaB